LLNSVTGGNGGNGFNDPDNLGCDGSGGDGGSGFGGGLNGTNVTISGCSFGSNSASGGTGGVKGPGGDPVGVVNGSPGAAIGGGLYVNSGTIDGTTVRQNTARAGAGMFVTGTKTITNCTINNNTASYAGGGIDNSGAATIQNCTISGNIGGGGFDPGGGAIYSFTLLSEDGLTIIGCTLSSNSPNGIVNAEAAFFGAGPVSIGNTILHNNGENLSSSGSSDITSLGYNLSSDAAGGDNTTGPGGILNGPGDKRNTDPQLDPAGLQNKGGPTQTIKLMAGSPAIDQETASVQCRISGVYCARRTILRFRTRAAVMAAISELTKPMPRKRWRR